MRTRLLTLGLLAGTAAGCLDPAASGPGGMPTWEDFVAESSREVDGRTVYVVDGDEPVRDLAELRAIYDHEAAERTRAAAGAPRTPRSTVRHVDGRDDVWAGTRQLDLTYCVSTAFGDDHDRMVTEMAAAAAAWSNRVRVRFRHVPAEDATCNAGNTDVDFDVRPWTSGGARAFFPSYDRADRSLFINIGDIDDGIGGADNVTTEGVLRHELGHTLGLRHEHIRVSCGGEQTDERRDLTVYDRDSVMHYPWCEGDLDSDLSLTPSDEFGGVLLYGDNFRPQLEAPRFVLDTFGYEAGSWRVDRHPRLVADVNNDGRSDLVGFGTDGVWLALGNGSGFGPAAFVLAEFGYAQGWRVENHPRLLADVNNDRRADIVGFANGGVYVALSTGTGFAPSTRWLADFGYSQGWRVERHPRFAVDLNRDGRADLVGFGNAGVYTALSTGSGFTAPRFASNRFGYDSAAGSWRVERHPRLLADVDNDGDPDVVGFASAGVMVAKSDGAGGLGGASTVIADFGYDAGGWRVERHPRLLADMNADGRADIVGFGNSGTFVALATSTGFAAPSRWLSDFGYDQGWRVESHQRQLADLDGDGRADVIGFGNKGVYGARSTGTGFGIGRLLVTSFGHDRSGGSWRLGEHPRFVGAVNTDRAADVIGCGDAGVWVARMVIDSIVKPPIADPLPPILAP